ncbi:hypothetical protein MKS78_20085 [Acinetobacter baumannii]
MAIWRRRSVPVTVNIHSRFKHPQISSLAFFLPSKLLTTCLSDKHHYAVAAMLKPWEAFIGGVHVVATALLLPRTGSQISDLLNIYLFCLTGDLTPRLVPKVACIGFVIANGDWQRWPLCGIYYRSAVWLFKLFAAPLFTHFSIIYFFIASLFYSNFLFVCEFSFFVLLLLRYDLGNGAHLCGVKASFHLFLRLGFVFALCDQFSLLLLLLFDFTIGGWEI